MGEAAPLLPDPDSTATPADDGVLNVVAGSDGGSASITFSLARATRVSLTLYDVQGRRVGELWSGPSGRGSHSIAWPGCGASGRSLSAGVYFLVLTTPGRRETQKFVLVR